MENKQLVFIDDSGDPGFKDASSDNFIITAVVFGSPDVAKNVAWEMDEYRSELGWRQDHEFKFAKNPKKVVAEILRRVRGYDFKIYAVYIQKKVFREIVPAVAPFFDKERLYNWTIKELLRMMPLGFAKVVIDGRANKQYMKRTATYLRREVNSDGRKKMAIKFEDSVTNTLLQLADLVAGSINRSLQPDKTDSLKYISTIKDRVVEIHRIDLR